MIVEIADENDNGPYFTKRLYTGGELSSNACVLHIGVVFSLGEECAVVPRGVTVKYSSQR